MLAPDETQLLYSLALHGRAELSLALDEYAGLVMVLLRFLAFKPSGDGSSTRAPRAEPAKRQDSAAPAAVTTAAKPSPRARTDEPPPWVDEPTPEAPAGLATPKAELDPTPLGDRWVQTVELLVERGELSPLARELAMQSQCVGVDGERWTLRVESESLRAQADKLRGALAALLGGAVTLDVERGTPTDTPALRAAAERERRQRDAERLIHDDPLVREMMSQFKTARIVPGSIKPH